MVMDHNARLIETERASKLVSNSLLLQNKILEHNQNMTFH